MNISALGLKLITDSEGFRSRTYKDSHNLDTIGYGHLIKRDEDFPDGVSEAVALALLEADVSWAEHAVNAAVKVPLTQNQFDVLVDFTFNLGAARLFHATFLQALNDGHHACVPAGLALYNHVGGMISRGLTRRRAAEGALWIAPELLTT